MKEQLQVGYLMDPKYLDHRVIQVHNNEALPHALGTW